MPGVTASTLTFSPSATASKPGTSWQPTMTKRDSSGSTPHSSLIRPFIGLSVSELAVKMAIFSCWPNAAVTAGSCASADMKTGVCDVVYLRASCWNHM